MKCTREREFVLRRNIGVEWKWKDYGLWWCRWKKVREDEGVVLFFILENRMKESPLSEEGEDPLEW